jgi:light-regulated signal transduction histidine kinase (bacteriophytochrome)
VVTVRVPPLHERGADLPGLARELLAALAARGGRSAPPLSDDAVAQLASRPWPGDVAELEAVLARALLRAGGGAVTAQHLLDHVAGPSAALPARGAQAQLELVVAEMAHELRNPLSTVKAFAQLPGLPDDAELRTRFAALASDAIARVDDVLENVLAFARLRAPAPADVEVKPLVDALVAEARPAFAERGVTLDYAPANGARCAADADQLAYAFRNVLAGVAREVPAQDAVRIDAGSPGVVRIAFDDRDGTGARLRRLVLGDDVATDDRTVLPLPFTLARSVLERNGGALTMDARSDGRVSLEIRLPAAAPKGG